MLHGRAVYTLQDGPPIEIAHHGEALRLEFGRPVAREVPAAPMLEAPKQPPGREPARRGR